MASYENDERSFDSTGSLQGVIAWERQRIPAKDKR
jgi:hypothetical protein